MADKLKSPKQLPQERRSWEDGLYDYRKETIELLFQRIIQALGLKVRSKAKAAMAHTKWLTVLNFYLHRLLYNYDQASSN